VRMLHPKISIWLCILRAIRKIVAEIEEIRSGLWDAKIKARITGVPIEEPPEDTADEKVSTEPVEANNVRHLRRPFVVITCLS